MPNGNEHYTVVVIGTGFGGTMTALPLAREFVKRGKGENVLMLERGTWWTTPVGTVQDKEVKTYTFLKERKQPVQFWSSQNHFLGFIDIFTRCFRRGKNEDGLFDFARLGRRRLWGLFGGENDGVSIIRASGVGGGSLIYSNITIRPPDFVLDDPRWPVNWQGKRDHYYNLARNAIGFGVLNALNKLDEAQNPPKPIVVPADAVNTGLSNIVMRSARLKPLWDIKDDALNPRGLRQIHLLEDELPEKQLEKTPRNRLWIDRARVFQTAMSQLTSDFGTVDLAINDLTPELEDASADPHDPPPNYPPVGQGEPKNYCERQGRCNVGCLPGARHTLNKQLMAAIHGTLKKPQPIFDNIKLYPLAEVDVIRALDGGGYEIRYLQRDQQDPSRTTPRIVTADKVIVSAGCLGTNEIMLRSKARNTLPNLSDQTGFGFSTNGDYVAFLEETEERVSLVRGPVTTSFGHFNTNDPKTSADRKTVSPATFHTIEDQGIPPALASIIGVGVPLIRSLANGRGHKLFIIWAIIRWLPKRLLHTITAIFTNFRERQDIFESEDELTGKMMCIVAMGREASVGRFRLGAGGRDTPLRVRRDDGKKFHEDDIYNAIRSSLDRLADQLSPKGKKGKFQSPFFNEVTQTLEAESIALSHPLGGCIMAENASKGVVDEYGHVFDKTKSGASPFYEGLYIADASIIPTALGVNPSLTISALSLRVVDKIIEELP